jgi:uncharacterized membrane protein YfbV (UPF0208 family)
MGVWTVDHQSACAAFPENRVIRATLFSWTQQEYAQFFPEVRSSRVFSAASICVFA